MRAKPADLTGFVNRDGVKIGYEVTGDGAATVLLAPTWPALDSRLPGPAGDPGVDRADLRLRRLRHRTNPPMWMIACG